MEFRTVTGDRHRTRSGFTIIELLIVMTIIALLLTLAAPRYFRHLDGAKETVLRENLFVLRDAIDKYRADKGVYPPTLNDLVQARYVRAVPQDPITERHDTWVTVAPRDGEKAVFDIKSGAPGAAQDGRLYASF